MNKNMYNNKEESDVCVYIPLLKAAVCSFSLCRHLCLKSAIAVIHGIINFTWVVLQHPWHSADEHICSLYEETEAVNHRAGVDTGIQKHRLFFLDLWPT